MNRRFVLTIIFTAAVAAGATAFAQQPRPYNQIMKEVGSTFASLRKNLEGNAAAAAAQDAAKMEALFTETEAFWARFDTRDAMGFAQRGRDATAAIGTAAKGNDIKAAQAQIAVIQKSCANCHFSHREETGKGFFIKP